MRHTTLLILFLLCSCSSKKLTTDEMSHLSMSKIDIAKLTESEMALDIDLLIIEPKPADTTKIVGKIAKHLQATEKVQTQATTTDTTKARHTQEKQPKTHTKPTFQPTEITEFLMFCCIIIIFALILRRKARGSTTL